MIGSVTTGLPEERITEQLETGVYTPYPNGTNLEELPYNDQEIVVCTICQVCHVKVFFFYHIISLISYIYFKVLFFFFFLS